jgi:hypothetical protein
MKKLIRRFRNWLFARRIRRVEKDAVILLWAFADAKSEVDLYLSYLEEAANARRRRNRSRSKRVKSDWTHEERVWLDRASDIRSRYQWGVDLDGKDAVLEATLNNLQGFFKKHKHSIMGQYK